ncbi:MAG: DUF4268 domain-containing protein [Nitrosarchaeum sp.]|nr:DUF4268 domain-containing protein [Nitrosarchaeum sp.]
MQKEKISKSYKVKPREVFDTEPEFTQWLSDNLDYLEDVLGLSFEDGKPEEIIGDFNCDIVARIVDSEEKVIIENQFERTDHDHLGKIITYGAGMDAKCIIWISPEFRDEHIAAIEWLNQNSKNETGSFFGVKLEFIRIENSSIAPNFSIVVKPNDWTKSIRDFGEQSDLRKFRYRFFENLIEEYSKIDSTWTKVKPVSRHYLRYGRLMRSFRLFWEHYTSQNTVGISIHIKTGDSSKDRAIYEELMKNKQEMEEFVGEELQWSSPKTQYYISTYKELGQDLERLSNGESTEVISWMAKTMKRMVELITKYGDKFQR